MTDNLQGSMGDAAWEARAAEKRPYRVLSPGAPGEVAYWMAMALFADMEARQELVEQVAERLVRNKVKEWQSVNDNRALVTKMFTEAGLRDPFALISGIAAGEDETTAFPVL